MPSRVLTKYAPMSVRSWLMALIAATMVPVFGLSLVLINSSNRAQEQVLSTLAVVAAKAKADAVNRQLSGVMTTMRVLASSASLRRQDWPAFHAAAKAGLSGTRTELILATDDHTQFLNTGTPYGEPLPPLSQTKFYLQAMSGDAPIVSGALKAPGTGEWVYLVGMRLTPPSGPVKFMMAVQPLSSLAEGFVKIGIEGDWNATLVDRDGRVLASTQEDEEAGHPYFLPMAASENGRVEQLEVDGRAVDIVSQRADLTGWSVKIWADSKKIREPIYRTYRNVLLGAVAMMVIAGFASYFFGRQISASVRLLARDAVRLGRGENVIDRPSPVNELTAVSHALAEASQSSRAAESEIRFLLREVAHRSKNQLTVVAALAKHSAESSRTVEDFNENLQQRIQGLARSTDLLLAASNSGTEIGDLLKAQVEPFRPAKDSALSVDGPACRLSAQPAQMLGQVFHELATNAAKHGAFSGPKGRLEVQWRIEDERLKLRWREFAVTAIAEPTRRGFGTRLVVRTIGSVLKGEVQTKYHSDGLELNICMPVAGVCQDETEG